MPLWEIDLEPEVILTTINEAYIIENLYPLYLYDLGIWQNKHGLFEENADIKTLTEQFERQYEWWSDPTRLFPYLIKSGEIPIGFILIASPPYCPTGIDYLLTEMFLLRSYRGRGLAEKAVNAVWDKSHGNWELTTQSVDSNIAAQKFWRKTLNNYTAGNYTEDFGTRDSIKQLIFRFVN